MLATCCAPRRADRFIGSPPLAFTFGLGGIVLFPLRIGASTVLLERAGPDDLLAAIARHRATVCFTAPTAYRAMLAKLKDHDVACLRKCVSAGEPLPKATFEAWHAATGIKLMDGIGATEMLHIFIAAREDEIRPGATGKPVPGYEARIIDDEGRDLPPGSVGRLAVRGPTGCRYLADERQRRNTCSNGWNVTGDTYLMDEDGYFWYQARSDDMIVSSGYNIAGPEVEAALLAHPAVAECGVVGAPDEERGMIVKAYVVLHPGQDASAELVKTLQDHVKNEIAPYKYPRAIEFVDFASPDADGQAPALRTAAHRGPADGAGERNGSRVRTSVNKSDSSKAGTATGRPTVLQPGRMACPQRVCQRDARGGPYRGHRRNRRLERTRRVSRRVRGPGSADAREHQRDPEGRWWRAAPPREADMVRARHRRVPGKPEGSRPGLS